MPCVNLAGIYDKVGEKLYINISGNIPKNITVEYIPRLDSVDEVVSDFWQDMLIRLAVANTKATVGRVRTKFKQSNALWTLDGDSLLEEGNTEYKELRADFEKNQKEYILKTTPKGIVLIKKEY